MRHFFLPFLFLFFYTYCSAQCPSPTSLRLETQQDIDDFSTTYPGVTEFDGNISIFESINGDITNLSGLNQLERINGCLTVFLNDSLTSFAGLENLTHVERNFKITGNYSLTTLNGLNNLDTVGRSFILGGVSNLQDLTGLESLSYVRLSTIVDGHPNLVSLNGLNNLKTTGDLYIENNNSLTGLTGLEGLERVKVRLVIVNNQSLSSLSGIDDLFSPAIDFMEIYYNPNLITCGIPSICRYAYEELPLVLHNNTSGCNNRTAILNNCTVPFHPCLPDGFTFTSQEQIDSFRINYPDCWDIGGDITISSSTITNTDGLTGVVSINGDLIIENNTLLERVSGLGDLRRINGELKIENNDMLENVIGLNTINYNTISNLIVNNNPQLGYTCVMNMFCNYVFYSGNPYSFTNNDYGCSDVEVYGNCSLPITLTSFTANIRNKTAVLNWQTATETNNSGFEIQKSKDGINWEKTGWQAGQGNTTATQSYTYTDENPFFGVSYYRLKQVDFGGNFEYSDVVSVEYKGKSTISLYPNPAENILHIADLNGQSIQEINLYNQAGQTIQVNMKTSNSINTSQLTPGIYILEIMINEEVFFEKFVVR